MPTDRPGKRFRVNQMPPGAYAGHQMIELEWKALTEAAAAVRFGLDEIQRGRIMVQELG